MIWNWIIFLEEDGWIIDVEKWVRDWKNEVFGYWCVKVVGLNGC